MKSWIISIEKGVGLLSLLSVILGAVVICVSVQEIVIALDSTVNTTELNIKIKISSRSENRTKTFVYIKDVPAEISQELLQQIRPIWEGASFAGIICGVVQVSVSLWFILNTRKPENQLNNAKWWIRIQLGSTFILMTTFGALIIQGVYPEIMVNCFAADFILTNIFVWFGVPTLRFHSDIDPKHVLRGPLWSTL